MGLEIPHCGVANSTQWGWGFRPLGLGIPPKGIEDSTLWD